MENEKNYNIALDLGVASVGWCVTDEESNVLKKGKRHMWGSRLFDEAKTAKDTRLFRNGRRRLGRRRERINILQSLFQYEIEREFPNFFPMLRESYLNKEDKNISSEIESRKYNLFSELNMTDADYYKEYPTIYHLRKNLMSNDEKFDIRLVYLAIHHIIKYRGNFLHEGDFSTTSAEEVVEKLEIVLEFLKKNYDITLKTENSKVFNIFQNNNTVKSEKKDELLQLFDYDKTDKNVVINVVNSILGYSFELNKIFNIDLEKDKFTFSKEIEDEEALINNLGENQEVYNSLKDIYSWYILQDILKGKCYISEAFIEKYDEYSRNFKMLKNVYKTYLPEKYNDMFRKNKADNYYAYNGKKCTIDELYKTIKNDFKEIPDDINEKNAIFGKISEETFLQKLNTTDNAAIPYQLHLVELEKILENQSKYYKSIEENKQKIIDLFEFRIPYYVGPLSKGENPKWGWVVRKNDENIRPWNFSEVVDEEATAEEFIRRMTNKCTYLLGEDVMPKNSLLYSEFCVLNELNNVKYTYKDVSRHLSKDTKKLIIEKLFKEKKKVTADMVRNLLMQEGIEVDSITGLADNKNFISNMSSYIDMKKIFGNVDESNFEICEIIIYWNTIFEEKKILKRKIKKEFPNLSDEQINKICKLKYIGWSRLSRKLIDGLKSFDNQETIMEKLRNTKYNFMQIINIEEFGFGKQIEELMPKMTKKISYDDVAEIPTSPANKRAIWQAILVVNDIKKVMKSNPKNIYIEFARNEGEKELKDNRAKKLISIYENMVYEIKQSDPRVYKELKKYQSDKTIGEKLYLYFIQNGKCMYSGEKLEIDNLSNYEVDHIIPQSYIKDDSIDNKALVIKRENQRKSDNLLLSDKIITKMRPYWDFLLKNGLINEKKYNKLTRTKMFETDEATEKFVQRQLVETRQITKHVTNLLMNYLPDTNIYAIRAENTHNFRIRYSLHKNRNVNDCHHAQDAYILSIIGNTLAKEWKGLNKFQYGKYVKQYIKDNKKDMDTKKEKQKQGIIVGFVSKRVDIEKVKETLNYKDYFVTKMLIEETGSFYNQTLYGPTDKTKPVIELKEGLDTSKYGGYSGEQKSYYSIIEYLNKKGKKEYQLVGIPIKYAYDIKNNKESLENVISKLYLKEDEQLVRIVKDKILKYQEYLDENNEPMIFVSDSEIKANKQLFLDYETNKLIYLMNTDNKKIDDAEKSEVELGYEKVYDALIEKMQKEYKCFSSATNRLRESKDKFIELNPEDKVKAINGILDVIRKSRGNLKILGQGESVGRMSGKTFKTDKLLEMTFIYSSVTGMFEERYKIDGMENSSNN